MSTPFNPFQSGMPGPQPAGNTGPTPLGPRTSGAEAAPLQIARPPTVLLSAAGAIAAAGLAVAVIGWQSWLALIGWALAGPLAIGVMGAFLGSDTRRRAEPIYVRPDWITIAYAAVAVLSAVGIIVGAIGFAIWMGRQ